MKKLVLPVLLIFFAFPAFSQEKDSRASFQGIWYGVEGEDKVIFIFIDDIFITNLDGGSSGRYSVENNNLILTNFRALVDKGWTEAEDESETDKIQYIFSGNRLILAFDGEPITFSQDGSDFPEWRY